jgi:hypothetical protein
VKANTGVRMPHVPEILNQAAFLFVMVGHTPYAYDMLGVISGLSKAMHKT